MKTIWILNHYAVPPVFGTTDRHYKIAQNLIKLGHDVTIFAASTVHNSNENIIQDSRKYVSMSFGHVPFVFINSCLYYGNGVKRVKNMLDYSFKMMSISKRFESKKPDIIYASSVHPFTWLAGLKLAERYQAAFIAETRDLWPETLISMGKIKRTSIQAKLLYWLERYIYLKADKYIFTLPGGKDYIEGKGLDSTKVRYINNGIDLEEFNHHKTLYTFSDKDLDNEDKYKVVYTGSMGMANSLHYLIKAAEIIMKMGLDQIQFILFGDGYLRSELERYVKERNISNVLFKGRVEKKYIPNILSKSDLNVFTGKNIDLYKYGLSLNKMFEYFASGKPTISNIQCGYNQLEEYRCGVTVESGSESALAEGIINFYKLPKDEYETYCRNALQAARDFDYGVLTAKLEEFMLENKRVEAKLVD